MWTCGRDYFTFNQDRSVKAIEFSESLSGKWDITDFHVGDNDATVLKMNMNDRCVRGKKVMFWNDNEIRVVLLADMPGMTIDKIIGNTALQRNKWCVFLFVLQKCIHEKHISV